jgi:hypothetical protein
MIPQPITNPDFGLRVHTAYDLEKTLVAFIKQLFDFQRMDNSGVNFLQPDTVPFDYTQRAQGLEGKVKPQVVRGRVPRTVAGQLAVDQLPDVPAIIVQAISARVILEKSSTQKTVTVRILVNSYDENPDSQGYQDCLNMVETLEIALTQIGLGVLNMAYPIELPLEWSMIEHNTFPHFIAEMTTTWILPAGRVMPDEDVFGIVPAEHIHLNVEMDPNLQIFP